MSRMMMLMVVLIAGCGAQRGVVQSGGAASPEPVASARTPEPAARDTTRRLSDLDRGWNRIPGREGTGCAQDSSASAFAFKVRPGLPDKVLVFLNGGGACWRAADCDPRHPTYTTSADSANDASVRAGIFDVSNDDNPFREYTMVFVPYCTGDAHLGARTVEYTLKGRSFSIRHEGAANVEAVLDWVYGNVRSPRVVVVAGSNSGAIATPVVAAKMARHYGRARVVSIADGAGALRAPATAALLAQWGAPEYLRRESAYRSLDSADFTFERLVLAAQRSASRVRLAQVDAMDDAWQMVILGQLGIRGAAATGALAASEARLGDALPAFRAYNMPGKSGNVLRSRALYTTKMAGTPLVEWIQKLVDGEAVQSVGMSTVTASKAKQR